MERTIDIAGSRKELNEWVRKSIKLFESPQYLDKISEVYPLQTARPERLEDGLRRRIISAHQGRRTNELIEILKNEVKFPYDEPIWYLMKNIQGCLENNPNQIQRIADSLYAMTAEETVVRLESAPKLNTQMGPMFTNWLRTEFDLLNIDDFRSSENDIFVLNASEEEALNFLRNELNQDLEKRPDLLAKVDKTYVIGEAKWIGSPGGNQNKQVVEVINLCKNQRGNVIRVGIIDGFPWAIYNTNGSIINDKTCVMVQESEYDILSALLLREYLETFLTD